MATWFKQCSGQDEVLDYAQHYWISRTNWDPELEPKPATFVFQPGTDANVLGFIVRVEPKRIAICAWQPQHWFNLPTGTEVISHKLSKAEVHELLNEALIFNPELRQPWIDALNQAHGEMQMQ